MSRLTLLTLLVAAACGKLEPEPEPEHPSTDPPPSWGVPLTGGTMLVTRDGHHAVIADPDRDRVVKVDLTTQQAVADIALSPGDEPGRLVEDSAGRIHVALRRGGALVTFTDPMSASGMVRRAVCSEPRGVAYDAVTDQVHVACATGELVSFAAAGGDATRRLRLDRDLRDVVVSGDRLIVTRFRTAELLTIDAAGAVVARVAPPVVKRALGIGISPGEGSGGDPGGIPTVDSIAAVAWRTIALPDGRLVVSHQRQLQRVLAMSTGGYGGGCGGGPMESSIAVVTPGSAPVPIAAFVHGALPIDIAVDRSGTVIAAISAGSQLITWASASALAIADQGECPPPDSGTTFSDGLGIPSSVAFAGDGALVVYYPEAPALVVRPADGKRPTTIELPGGFGYDAGRAMFHTQTALGIACASCHPEGRDDGRVWEFDQIGLRRTQSLAGHVLRRAPYHWSGDLANLDQLMDDVFTNRMIGGAITHSQRLSLGPWLDRIPAPAAPPARDPAAAARGKQLFESSQAACTTCHAGELLTNNQRFDVATGGVFKVPSLIGVGARPPYLHDGCAATLADRFGGCGGGDQHGHTASLTEPEVADLVAYLDSL